MNRNAAAAYLVHPIVLAALVVWIVNDHYGKAAVPGFWTGKLSDVASLIVFPLLPLAALDLWRHARDLPPPGTGIVWVLVVATGMVMVTINLFEPAAFAYRFGLGLAQWPLRVIGAGGTLPELRPVHLTMDASDLLALPALLVPLSLGRAAARAEP